MVTPSQVRGVRWRPDTGFELRCDDCAARKQSAFYWPLTVEFWNPGRSLARCRACWRARDQDARRRLARPATDRDRADWRAYRRANRSHINTRRRARYAAQNAA